MLQLATAIIALFTAASAHAMYPVPNIPPVETPWKIYGSNYVDTYETTAPMEVLEEPKSDSSGAPYATGSLILVIGEANKRKYFYVSPCRSCDNGFIKKSEFLKKSKVYRGGNTVKTPAH